MKIFLIDPSINIDNQKPAFLRTIIPSSGLASIAAVLKKGGHDVFIEDQNASGIPDHKLVEKIKYINPDFVGISCLTSAHHKSIALCSMIKAKMPSTYTVLGNIHASYFAEFFLRTGKIDFIVHGEGEFTFLELINTIGRNERYKLHDVKGISFLKEGSLIRTPPRPPIENIDELPFPAWGLFDLKYYRFHPMSFIMGRLLLAVQASRGCKYHCDFCTQDKLGIPPRYKSTQRIVDEIVYLYNTLHIGYFGFLDSYFPWDEKITYDFCNAYERTGLHKKLKWGTSCYIQVLNKKMLTRMKEAGLLFISCGFESSNERMMKNFGNCDADIKASLHQRMGWGTHCYVRGVETSGSGKSMTKEKCSEIVNISKKLGIKTIGLFLIGFPGETREMMNDTIRFAIKLDCDLARIALVIPYPGSKLYERLKNKDTSADEFEGFIGQQFWYGLRHNGHMPQRTALTDREFEKAPIKAAICFYLRPLKIIKLIALFACLLWDDVRARWFAGSR